MDLSFERPPRRIVILGTTGSGKTTLGRRLSASLSLRHVELDALHWEPDWVEADPETMRRRLTTALEEADEWVTDGNYTGIISDLTWTRADLIIWLDYSFARVMRRLFWRSLRRGVLREELWSGNRERLAANFASRDSLFLWARKTHWRHRREYPPRFGRLAPQARVLRMRDPRATERLARSLERTAAPPPAPATE
ncbi:MAG: adenylate kinase [Chloroflexi bacterium]|nr:adenylate kinase [Chloroflexota bacterium]